MNRIGFVVSTVLLALALLSSMLFVVDQRQFGVVYSFGQIKEVITEPGLRFKLPPPFQNVVFLDRRVLTLDSPETGSLQTAEKKNLVIDWLVKWRIADPKQFIRTNSGGVNISTAENRLTSVVQDALKNEVNKRTARELLASEREEVMKGVQQRLADDAKSFGIEIVDVRIKRVDYPKEVADSVYRRMESERKQVANELRSTGQADGEKIRADADRQREVILANAYRDAQKVKGEGDAKASALYADSVGRDPQFAQFYRSLEVDLQQEGRRGGGRSGGQRLLQGLSRQRRPRGAGRAEVRLGQRPAVGRHGPDAGVRGPAAVPVAQGLAQHVRAAARHEQRPDPFLRPGQHSVGARPALARHLTSPGREDGRAGR
jgi:membrane protease subunit HflC